MIKNKIYPLNLIQLCCLVIFGLLSSSIWAAQLYVLENLRLRTEPSLEGAILATIKKGEAVEVLGIEGDFTRIESGAGTTGWVASSFLTTEKPSEATTTIKPSTKPPKPDMYRATIKKQQNELRQLKEKIKKQEQTIQQLAQKTETDKQKADDMSEKQTIEISESEQKIAKIREIIGATVEQTDSSSNEKPLKLGALTGLHYSMGAGLLLLGFVFGIMWGDFIQRRRHGGYRV